MSSSTTNIRSEQDHYLEMAQLHWDLVQRERQNWSFLSLSVVAAGAWLLARGTQGIEATLMGYALGAASLSLLICWLLGQRAVRRTRTRLHRLERLTGCSVLYPLLRVLGNA